MPRLEARSFVAAAAVALALPAAGCSHFEEKVAPPSPGFPNIGYSTLRAKRAGSYRLYPGGRAGCGPSPPRPS